MKILHTADWHLGRTLYGKKRYDEFSKFLDWLIKTIDEEKIHVLLIAGDIFDTSTPSNYAQELYYRFLYKVSTSCCRHIIVTGGNHDSPSFLNAPKELLKTMNVTVVGAMTENLEDEVIVLHEQDQPKAIICAVPYLRDKDVRTVEPGETIDSKNTKLIEGIKKHYSDVCTIAEQKKHMFEQAGYRDIPIIAMGHLFAAGGKTVEGDGVRDLYVGSLTYVGADVFPQSIDYLALGHLHVPQCVNSSSHIRYCGSPIPMGFGEASHTKKVFVIAFDRTTPMIQEIEVPCFQPLKRIVGSLDAIHEKIEELKKDASQAWLEIEYTGNDTISDLREKLEKTLTDSTMEICKIKNKRVYERLMSATHKEETLEDLNPNDVFSRCLDASKVPHEDRHELMTCYNEIVKSLCEEDVNEK